jgi:hypothetical protein
MVSFGPIFLRGKNRSTSQPLKGQDSGGYCGSSCVKGALVLSYPQGLQGLWFTTEARKAQRTISGTGIAQGLKLKADHEKSIRACFSP